MICVYVETRGGLCGFWTLCCPQGGRSTETSPPCHQWIQTQLCTRDSHQHTCEYKEAEVNVKRETEINSFYKWPSYRLILFLGAVQPSMRPVFVYHQETGDPAAHKHDRGESFCSTSGTNPSAYITSCEHWCISFPAGYFNEAHGRGLWSCSRELQGAMWWLCCQIWHTDSRIPPVVRCTSYNMYSFAPVFVQGGERSRSATFLKWMHLAILCLLVWSEPHTSATKLTLWWLHRGVPSLRLRVVPHAGCAESTSPGSQLHRTCDLLFPSVCVCPSPQRHPQGLTLS